MITTPGAGVGVYAPLGVYTPTPAMSKPTYFITLGAIANNAFVTSCT